MTRHEIINTIGQEYLQSNIENDEFSYKQALKRPLNGSYKADIRFEHQNLSIIIETKKEGLKQFKQKHVDQLFKYIELERQYRPNNRIVGILYDVINGLIRVWRNDEELDCETTINNFQYYLDLFNRRVNNKNKVIETTNQLNVLLHEYGINEKLRSQFVGSLLVALNNGLEYDTNLKNTEIIARISEILETKIENDENKRKKIKLLIKILKDENIEDLKPSQFVNILNKLGKELIPFIDSSDSKGDDLLNLFFTTFNKYVGKADKNQAFTPTHITDFMCEIVNIRENSRVLDPTCGSGAFLVQAMSKMLALAGNNQKQRTQIKKNQIFGIEKSDIPFGLATTNMMIHEDGKSNVIQASCFDQTEWIKNNNINTVLMNPPFNGLKMPRDCPKTKKGADATKGLYFVKYVADVVNQGMLATILPLQCAIGSDAKIAHYKKMMLQNHTLKAVFSLPNEIFYPGASVNACIMLFELGRAHNPEIPTFFGYYKDDGFTKKKNRGRVEKIDWTITKDKWLSLFRNSEVKPGLSVKKCVTYEDEWLAEAYMETDYSKLTEEDFIQTIRDFIGFKVKNGESNE